ncbi:sushi, nidogen and EGF-like domain-containing protein 1, partial [Lingula anatina]
RNTFQSIMVTDGRSSFVIFLYNEIHWTTGTASGGTQDGLNGVAAQVGFNAGDGKNYYAVNGSRTGAIINIGSMSNVGQPGKWVFRTDDLDIKDPECNLNGKADISLNPNKVQLKGGDVIFISGPCFKKSMDIRCQFGSVQVTGSFESVLRVSCVVPPNLNPGVTNVGLSTDGGKTVTNIQTPLTI